MLAVADPTQDIYDRFEWTSDAAVNDADFGGEWIELDTSFRMPQDLLGLTNEFAEEYLEGEQLHGSAPGVEVPVGRGAAGSIRRWIDVDSPNHLGRAIGREVVRLLQTHPELRPVDVAFVCDYHHDGVAAVRVIEKAGYPVHHIFSRDPDAPRRRRKHRFWPGADAVKGCTAHSFKGWETPVLVTGIGVDDRAQRLAYVAMTRVLARADGSPSHVSIVNADRRLEEFGSRFNTPDTGTDAELPPPPVSPFPTA